MAKLLINGICSCAENISSISTSHSFESSLKKSLTVVLGWTTGIFGLADLAGEVGIQGSSHA